MNALRGWVLFTAVVVGASASAEDYFVGSWNVENLFDTADDPEVEGDEEFTPDGDKAWTEQRLERKLRNLTTIIVKFNGGKGPDILGLGEVENRKVIQALIARLPLPDRDYKIVHKESPSGRGIDCAFIYDAKKFTLVHEKFHEAPKLNTRDIVEAKFKAGDDALTVFMNHWPSRAHDKSQRMQTGVILRKRIDQILKDDPAADIVVLGDLNDTPPDESVRDSLGSTKIASEATNGVLFNTTAELHEAGKGTYVYDEKWEAIDQLLVSPGLLDSKGFRWKTGSTAAQQVIPEQMFVPNDKKRIPRPNRTYTGDNYHATGYSDHLPIGAVIERGAR